jgi:hypothetical protein
VLVLLPIIYTLLVNCNLHLHLLHGNDKTKKNVFQNPKHPPPPPFTPLSPFLKKKALFVLVLLYSLTGCLQNIFLYCILTQIKKIRSFENLATRKTQITLWIFSPLFCFLIPKSLRPKKIKIIVKFWIFQNNLFLWEIHYLWKIDFHSLQVWNNIVLILPNLQAEKVDT